MTKIVEAKDPLTGLPKKAEFDDLLEAALGESGTAGPVSLALVDIDKFLQVNEKHGHMKGDEVILSIAKAISLELKPEKPQLCRIGGDEIAVIFKKTEKETAFLRLEQVRRVVAELQEMRDIVPQPTISIGLATYPDDGGTRQEIVRKADDALFRAKSAGRNRVGLAREEKMVPKTSHFTQGQLERLGTLSLKEGVGEAELLREALDDLLKKYQWSRTTEEGTESGSEGHRRRVEAK
jgi:diguanylate cyclase (GGDEF)-like protein